MKKALIMLLCLLLLGSTAVLAEETAPKDARYPYEYLGMTFGELKSLLGEDYSIHESVECIVGPTVWYKDGRTPYLFSFEGVFDANDVQDDDVISEVFVEGNTTDICEGIYGEESINVLSRLYTVGGYRAHKPNTPEDIYIWFTDTHDVGESYAIRIKDLNIKIWFYYFTMNPIGDLDRWAPPVYVSVCSIPEGEDSVWHNEKVSIEPGWEEHPVSGELAWRVTDEDGFVEYFTEDPETGELIPYEISNEAFDEYLKRSKRRIWEFCRKKYHRRNRYFDRVR